MGRDEDRILLSSGEETTVPEEASLSAWLSSARDQPVSWGGGRAVWDHIYHCGFLQWSHLEPGEVGAACPSACWMKGLLPRGQGGWSRGRGHGRQRECTRPLLLSLLRTLWRERKSERDYTAPPSTTLTPHAPEGALQGAPGCVPVCARAHAHPCTHVHMRASVCSHVHVCLCGAHTCRYLRACMHTHTSTCARTARASVHVHVHVCTPCLHSCVHTRGHVFACVCVCGRMCLCCMCGHVFVCVRTVHATCAPVGVFS